MENYLYSLDDIESNHEAFAEHGKIVASDAVKKMLRTGLPSQELVPNKNKADQKGAKLG
jgi:malonyl-CoA decarboxylase